MVPAASSASFQRLWIGQTISVFGSVVGIAAISLTAVLFLHASPFQLSLLSAARLVPGLLAGLVAGAWVDRLHRRPILIWCDVGRALLLASIPIAARFGILNVALLGTLTLLVSTLTVFFDVAYQSYLPSLVETDQLVASNARLSASAAVSEVGGFALGGWLVGLFTAPFTIAIDALSFAISALAVWTIRKPEPPRAPPDPHTGIHPDMRREIAEGLRAVIQHPLLRTLAACSLSKDFFGGMYGTLAVLYMARDLGFSPGVLGSIWAVGGASSFIGAMAATRATRRFGLGTSMIAGLALFGISLLFVPLAQGANTLAAALLILQQLSGDGAATLYRIDETSLRQAAAPPRLLGRVNASAQFIALSATLAGSLVAGALGNAIGVRPTLFIAAFGTLLSTLPLLLSPIRRLRTVQ